MQSIFEARLYRLLHYLLDNIRQVLYHQAFDFWRVPKDMASSVPEAAANINNFRNTGDGTPVKARQ